MRVSVVMTDSLAPVPLESGTPRKNGGGLPIRSRGAQRPQALHRARNFETMAPARRHIRQLLHFPRLVTH